MTIACVLGDRADYVAASALVSGARERGIACTVVTAGQASSTDIDLVAPVDVQVLLGKGSPVLREGLAMMGIEREILEDRPSAMVVFGAHEVAVAATLVAAKLHIPLWHAGAGRWAFEARDPDHLSSAPVDEDLIAVLAEGLLAPTEFAATALAGARYDVKRIWVTGPLEAETLERHRHRANAMASWTELGYKPAAYVAVSLADDDVMPGHPLPFVNVSELSYMERLSLVSEASVCVTDSFDLQLEACLMHVPAIVCAPGTPLAEVRAAGAAKLCPRDSSSLASAIAEQAARTQRTWPAPPLFDRDVSARALGLIAPRAAAPQPDERIAVSEP